MPQTIANAVNSLAAAFSAAGLDTPRLDARMLVAHVVAMDPAQVFMRGQEACTEVQLAELNQVKTRRVAREPVGRILGYREFYGKKFLLGPATLEPRPDSETLVDAALKLRCPSKAVRILDLGTGTGCLLLSLLGEWPEATGLGIDLASDAVDVARTNAEQLGLSSRVTFQTGNWCEGLTDRFDMIVSNPPYIADGDIDGLEPEVSRFDPMLALRGGADGLAAYRALIPSLRPHLVPHGVVLLEVGSGQAMDVVEICKAHNLSLTALHHDLAGVARVVEVAAIQQMAGI